MTDRSIPSKWAGKFWKVRETVLSAVDLWDAYLAACKEGGFDMGLFKSLLAVPNSEVSMRRVDRGLALLKSIGAVEHRPPGPSGFGGWSVPEHPAGQEK